jgi:hypothetical protein
MPGLRSLNLHPFLCRRSALRIIFLNYRRNDSEGEAGRLFDELTLHFSSETVFMDVAGIQPGRDFRKAIDERLATCSVLLAIIGHEWLESKNMLGLRRLDDANDLVRIELASALRRDIPVIPVLVHGAKMPQPEQLPDDMRDLAYRNAVELTHARWKSDVQVLIRALRPYLDAPGADAKAAHGAGEQTRGSNAFAAGAPPSDDIVTQRTETQKIVTPALGAQTIERVSRELAAYVGPISETVVKRAAKQCSSVEDLCRMVAQEIEADADRFKFLKSCGSSR